MGKGCVCISEGLDMRYQMKSNYLRNSNVISVSHTFSLILCLGFKKLRVHVAQVSAKDNNAVKKSEQFINLFVTANVTGEERKDTRI